MTVRYSVLLAITLASSMVVTYAAPNISRYTAVPSNTSTTIYTGSKPSMWPVVFTQATFNAADTSNSNDTTTSQAQFQLNINNSSGNNLYVLVVPVSSTQTDQIVPCKAFSNMAEIQYVNSQSATCSPIPSFSPGASSYNLYISNSPFSAIAPSTSANYQGLTFQCSIGLSVVQRTGTNKPYKLVNGLAPYTLDVKAGACSIGES